MSGELSVVTEVRPGAVVLRLRGSAGMWAVEDLRRAIDGAIAAKQPLVVLELSGLEFVASLGMGEFLRLAAAQRDAGGRAAAAGPPPEIARALRRARIDALIPICADLGEALALSPTGEG